MMYPEVPYSGISWPITQHAGVLNEEVFDGLLHACLLCRGQIVDAEKINGYLVENDILTANIRADSHQVDAWRDYQQILSEFGLIYSTRISKILRLTSVALAYLNHNITYRELVTLQTLRYQYPNGHKSQLSPSLVQSYGDGFTFDSFTSFQAEHKILLRPAALTWHVLFGLWQRGFQPILSLDEMQSYVVRCTLNSDADACVEAIIKSREGIEQLMPMPRARRNMADWLKILNQTLLFNLNSGGDTIALSTYSIRERTAVDQVCSTLSEPSSFWHYEGGNFKESWFQYYGDYDNSIAYVLKENR